jgi:hypothetical protein
MNQRSVAFVASFVLAVGVSAAHAEDRDFYMKSGTRIRGELVDETADQYVVKVGGGTIHLAKTAVEKVEKVVLPADPFAPTPRSAPNAPKPEAVADARKLLESLAAARDNKTADLKQLESTAAALPLETIVAILADPQSARGGAPQIALARVKSDGAASRPLLVRALEADAGTPSDALCSALGAVGDDENGTLEMAIVKRIEATPKAPPAPLLAVLHGTAEAAGLGTLRAIPALLKTIGTAADDASVNLLRGACSSILERSNDPDTALEPIREHVATANPTLVKDQALLSLLQYYRHGEDIEGLVSDAVARAEVSAATEPAAKSAVNDFLLAGYRDLVAIRTDSAIDRVLSAAGMDRPIAQRRTALAALADLVRPKRGDASNPALAVSRQNLTKVAKMLSQEQRTPEERAAIVSALQAITRQSIGDDVNAWDQYVGTLH